MTHRVLIVEDELLVALDLEYIVTSAGFDVVGIAPDMSSAQALAKDAQIALVDLNLRDGFTGPKIACDLAKAHGTKIIFVTANPAQIGAPPENALGYIQKPFSGQAVLVALETAKGGRPGEIPQGGFHPFAGQLQNEAFEARHKLNSRGKDPKEGYGPQP